LRSEARRIEILEAICGFEPKSICLVIDKSKVLGDFRRFPKSFYKYTQKLLHFELHRLYGNVDVTIDKFGSPEYQLSFKKYIECEVQLSLFESDLTIRSAKTDILLQVADLLGGTKRKLVKGEIMDVPRVEALLSKVARYYVNWPDDFSSLQIEGPTTELDKKIAATCLECAKNYVKLHGHGPNLTAKVIALEYLLFVVRHMNPKAYTLTGELMKWLDENGYDYEEEEFRSNIIGSLRDDGIIISGSRRGLKIPITMGEMLDYINYSSRQFIPMIKRTKRAVEVLKAKSLGTIDLLEYELRGGTNSC
jgi:hypothetical protein